MKIFTIVSIYMVAFSVHAESGPEPAKEVWFACKKNAECIVAAGACGPEAVNKKYKTPFEEHADKLKPFVDCSPIEKKKFKAVCETKRCVLK